MFQITRKAVLNGKTRANRLPRSNRPGEADARGKEEDIKNKKRGPRSVTEKNQGSTLGGGKTSQPRGGPSR